MINKSVVLITVGVLFCGLSYAGVIVSATDNAIVEKTYENGNLVSSRTIVPGDNVVDYYADYLDRVEERKKERLDSWNESRPTWKESRWEAVHHPYSHIITKRQKKFRPKKVVVNIHK